MLFFLDQSIIKVLSFEKFFFVHFMLTSMVSIAFLNASSKVELNTFVLSFTKFSTFFKSNSVFNFDVNDSISSMRVDGVSSYLY